MKDVNYISYIPDHVTKGSLNSFTFIIEEPVNIFILQHDLKGNIIKPKFKTTEMEYLYSSYTKLIDDKIYYFVKKMMTFPEFKGVADVLAGYGMHTDFEKACNICGIDDIASRKQLLVEQEQRKLAEIPKWLPIVQTTVTRNTRKKHPVQNAAMVNRWLVERGAAALN